MTSRDCGRKENLLYCRIVNGTFSCLLNKRPHIFITHWVPLSPFNRVILLALHCHLLPSLMYSSCHWNTPPNLYYTDYCLPGHAPPSFFEDLGPSLWSLSLSPHPSHPLLHLLLFFGFTIYTLGSKFCERLSSTCLLPRQPTRPHSPFPVEILW